MKAQKFMARLITLCMLLALLVVPFQNVKATESANDAVLDARNGILQVMVSGERKDGTLVDLYGGTGFLLGTKENAQTVITNHHVVHPLDYESPEVEQDVRDYLGLEEKDKLKLYARIVVKRDVYIKAEIVNESAEADFAILKLEQPIYDRNPLILDTSDNVKTTEEVYALGFPRIVQAIQSDEVYTSDDVTVTSGIVSKTSDVQLVNSPIPCITHSATITSGNSGGALLNSAGYVVGVNRFSDDNDKDSKYFYSVKISEVVDVLNALGIDYMSADGSTAQPETETANNEPQTSEDSEIELETIAPLIPMTESAKMDSLKEAIEDAELVDLTNVDDDSALEFQDALDAAKAVYSNAESTDAQIQLALDDLTTAKEGLVEKKGLNTMLIIVIAAAVILVIIAVVVIIGINSSKKKKAEEKKKNEKKAAINSAYNGGASRGGFQPNTPFTPQGPSSFSPDEGSMPTGVLNEGSNATTVLNNQSIPSAYLIRKKNNERISITKSVFKIGKERRKVDYCVSDNTNVSRTHADIIYKDGSFYVVDNNTTNGTSVNGASIAAGQEKKLSGNEIIRMADEEFQFKLF